MHLGRTQYAGILTWHRGDRNALTKPSCRRKTVQDIRMLCEHNLRLGGDRNRGPIPHHGTGKRPPVAEEPTASELIKAWGVSSKPRSTPGSIAAGDGKDEMTSEDCGFSRSLSQDECSRQPPQDCANKPPFEWGSYPWNPSVYSRAHVKPPENASRGRQGFADLGLQLQCDTA